MATTKVLSVVSEIYPLIKTGGLADVAGALPGALAAVGVEMRTLVPGYPAITAALENGEKVLKLKDLFGGPASVVAGRAKGLDLFVLDAPHLFDRPGNPYHDADGVDWPDNPFRFAALSRVGAEIGLGGVKGFVPDVVHTHDWQTGLTAAYLEYDGRTRPGTVATVHNLAFQGQYPKDLLGALRLPPHAWGVDGVEYYDTIGFLKAALRMSDRITTVSPTYAAEIRTGEGGMGLEGLLAGRAPVVSGILNGIDVDVWNPATDPLVPTHYDAATPSSRRPNKSALQKRFGIKVDRRAMVFGVVSRLSWQKGLDMVLAGVESILSVGGQLVLLGSGDRGLVEGFRHAAAAHPGRVGVVIGYDEALAHLIQAGSDALLVPSRFEPCGLTQLCALRYGAIPIVTRVGGLADTIVDANEMALDVGAGTGVMFSPPNPEMFRAAVERAASLYADQPTWRRMMKNAMRTDVSWGRSAARYAKLYEDLVDERSS
ncbi:MAG: glycogen synthase GlgA [Hyphomicrobiales bacterium]|nr:glycogen synthase GlgA [Hyphomicrobiales bacterium]